MVPKRDGHEFLAEATISQIVYRGQISYSVVIQNTSALLRKLSILEKQAEELASLPDAFMKSWLNMLGFRDKEAVDHAVHVSEMAVKLAKNLGIKKEELVHIRRGALLHDVGKINIPDKILQKPAQLNDEEIAIVHMHPMYAYEVLS